MSTIISRRDVLKGAALGAGITTIASLGMPGSRQAFAESANGVVLGSAGGTGVVTLDNDQACGYQAMFDVVVVGAGGAGLTAALQAAQNNASVAVIEAAPNYFGSDTSLSDAQVYGYNTSVQKEAGIEEESLENAMAYLRAVGEGYQNDELCQVLYDQSASLVDWLINAGVEFFPEKMNFSGPEEAYADEAEPVMHGHLTANTTGRDLTDPLFEACTNAGVEFIYNTRGTRLITDPDGRVVGVVTDKGNFRASKGVVLATSGFSKNQQLINAFVPELRGASSGPHSQGDGIVMGASVGAALGNMWLVAPKNSVASPAQGIFLNAPTINWRLANFEVNTSAERFHDEGAFYGTKVDDIEAQDQHFCWAIFDQATADEWCDLGATPHMSRDFDLEAQEGWIYKADTVEGLAEQIDLDPEALAATQQRYNEMASSGVDEDFGRTYNLRPIDQAPFYALKVIPGGSETAGGLVINGDAEVLNWSGDVIPGLYAGGSTTCGWAGKVYPGSGVAITNALLFGRIAGANAAAEQGSNYEGKLAPDAGSYKDVEPKAYDLAEGEYVGTGSGMGGDVDVKIAVENDAIISIEVLANAETPGIGSKAVNALPDEILVAQGVENVDDISGATISSRAIKAAVADAMEQAGL